MYRKLELSKCMNASLFDISQVMNNNEHINKSEIIKFKTCQNTIS